MVGPPGDQDRFLIMLAHDRRERPFDLTGPGCGFLGSRTAQRRTYGPWLLVLQSQSQGFPYAAGPTDWPLNGRRRPQTYAIDCIIPIARGMGRDWTVDVLREACWAEARRIERTWNASAKPDWPKWRAQDWHSLIRQRGTRIEGNHDADHDGSQDYGADEGVADAAPHAATAPLELITPQRKQCATRGASSTRQTATLQPHGR